MFLPVSYDIKVRKDRLGQFTNFSFFKKGIIELSLFFHEAGSGGIVNGLSKEVAKGRGQNRMALS